MQSKVYFNDFVNMFEKMERKNQFSYKGKKALYEYLTDCEDEMGEDVVIDVIALCCEYTEYSNLADFQNDYSEEYISIKNIENSTIVIPLENSEGFIIQNF